MAFWDFIHCHGLTPYFIARGKSQFPLHPIRNLIKVIYKSVVFKLKEVSSILLITLVSFSSTEKCDINNILTRWWNKSTPRSHVYGLWTTGKFNPPVPVNLNKLSKYNILYGCTIKFVEGTLLRHPCNKNHQPWISDIHPKIPLKIT